MIIAEIDNNVDLPESRLIFGRKGNKVVKNICTFGRKKGRIVTKPMCVFLTSKKDWTLRKEWVLHLKRQEQE